MKIVTVPFSGGSLGKNVGCEEGPKKVLDTLKNISLNEKGNNLVYDVVDLKFDGDFDKLQEEISNVEGDIFLGGDHSITYGAVKGLEGSKGLLIFDAHPDLEVGTKSISHEDYLRKLIENNIVDKDKIVLVGVRNWSKNEKEFLQENNIRCFNMKQIFEYGVKNVCESVMEIVQGFEKLYLSIDIDVVDPAYAPGTGYLESGGLTSRELLYFLQRLKQVKNLRRVDLVEINPRKDFNNKTSLLGAKILSEII